MNNLEKIKNEVKDFQSKGICSACFGAITEFKDRESRDEFNQSGLCQKCQDEFFCTLKPDCKCPDCVPEV